MYEPGRRGSSQLFSLFYQPNEMNLSRFGLTVSGKLGKAVVRNRLKRRLREVLRLHQEKVPPGWDIVINARHGAVKASYERMERDLLRLLPSRAPRPDAGAKSELKSDHPKTDAPR